MKPEDLMINDWVQNTCHIAGKVIGFRYYPDTASNDIVIAYHDNSTSWSSPNQIEPIPLTDDILDKNGWVKEPVEIPKPFGDGGLQVKGYRWLYAGRELYPFSLLEMRSGGLVIYYVMNKIQYTDMCVHELQHALRLCGLTDLANNFKV